MEENREQRQDLLMDLLPQVSSQLRGSLGNIHGALNHLLPPEKLEGDLSAQQHTAILWQSYYRVLRVVNNLSAAPLLMEETPFEKENTELVEWLSDLCRQAQPLAELKGVALSFRTELRSHIAAIHRGHLERLVWNLLSNALKFTDKGGSICVELVCGDGQLTLKVSDTGCGISSQLQDTIFDRYRHTERMDPLPHGLGLGLPLCRCIAQRHGGRLLLQSEEGRGTTVLVSLPDVRQHPDVMRDNPFHYAGGFQPVLMELSDALPHQAYLPQYLDE